MERLKGNNVPDVGNCFQKEVFNMAKIKKNCVTSIYKHHTFIFFAKSKRTLFGFSCFFYLYLIAYL